MNSNPDDTQPDDPFHKQREELVTLLANRGLVTKDDYRKLLNELALEDQFDPIRELVESYVEGREQMTSGLTLRDSVSAWRFDINNETGDLSLRAESSDRGKVVIPGALAVRARFGTSPPPEISAQSHLENGLAVGEANGKPIELVAQGSGPIALEIVAVTDASEVSDYSGRWLGSWRKKIMTFTGWGLVPQMVLHAIATRAGEGGRPAIQVTPRRYTFAWGTLFAILGYLALTFLFVASERWASMLSDEDDTPPLIKLLQNAFEQIAEKLDPFVVDFAASFARANVDQVVEGSGLTPFALALACVGVIYSNVRQRRRRSLQLRWRRTSKLMDYPAEYKLEISGGHSKSDAPKIRCHITQLGP